MPSIRAEAVAEILWELKQLEKLASYTEVAGRAGFKPGVNGKTIITCIESVRKEWPHLQWWRVVQEDGHVTADTEHAVALTSNGYELNPVAGRKTLVEIVGFEAHNYSWTITTTEVEPASAV